MTLLAGFAAMGRADADDFEQEPIRYSQSQPDNRVSQLIDRISAGDTKLPHEPHFGYLRSLLSALDVPTLARAARFLVLAVDLEKKSTAALGDVYAGWGWSV